MIIFVHKELPFHTMFSEKIGSNKMFTSHSKKMRDVIDIIYDRVKSSSSMRMSRDMMMAARLYGTLEQPRFNRKRKTHLSSGMLDTRGHP